MAVNALGRDDATPEELLAAARDGDNKAIKPVSKIANEIAASFAIITALLDPGAIVFGWGRFGSRRDSV